MELSTVHGLLLLFIGVAIMCYSAQYATLLRPTGCASVYYVLVFIYCVMSFE